jgi:hypothetical protein
VEQGEKLSSVPLYSITNRVQTVNLGRAAYGDVGMGGWGGGELLNMERRVV